MKKQIKKPKNSDITTVKLQKETKERLDKLKEFERESYNQTIRKILHILNVFRKNPVLGNKLLKDIENARLRRERYTEVYERQKNK